MKKYIFTIIVFCTIFSTKQPLWAMPKDDNKTAQSDTKPIITNQNQKNNFGYKDLESQTPKTNDIPKDTRLLTADDVKDIIFEVLPKFSGYLQAGYSWTDKNGGNISTFQMKRMRLFLDKKISDHFDVRAQFEVFSGSTDSEYKKKVMTIMDAYINAHVNKAIHFRLGQYFLPLGFENYDLSPKTLETIDFSNINYRMVCRNAVSTPNLIDYGRDIGIMMYGDLFENSNKKFSYISYNLSVTNGNLPTLNDNNRSKDLIGRIMIRPIEKLRIIGSYNWGEYQSLRDDLNVENKNYLSMHRIIAGAWYYDPNGLSLRTEYGHIESKKAQVREDGLYVLAAYKVGKFLPVARWDMYRDHKNEYSPNNRDAILVGCTYQIIKDIKIQTAYTHSIYTNKAKDTVLGSRTKNGNGIQIMCMASF